MPNGGQRAPSATTRAPALPSSAAANWGSPPCVAESCYGCHGCSAGSSAGVGPTAPTRASSQSAAAAAGPCEGDGTCDVLE